MQLATKCEPAPFVVVPLYLSLFVCRLTEETGLIHDGVGNYSIGVKCSWLIDARGYYVERGSMHHHHHHGHHLAQHSMEQPMIRIHLEEFATECGWDHLYVYDGDSVESPLLAVFR